MTMRAVRAGGPAGSEDTEDAEEADEAEEPGTGLPSDGVGMSPGRPDGAGGRDGEPAPGVSAACGAPDAAPGPDSSQPCSCDPRFFGSMVLAPQMRGVL
ncbi:hypothetical protein GCM10009680_52080 [Streptomyces yatensis]|uniref:Uncharacterized protein n=1 Tax=Streptomyces yatensis TaxID=155177 RepID=A0ABP4UJ32_9ACTN